MKPWNFTVEETNLIAIYHSGSRSELLEQLRTAQLLLDLEPVRQRCLQKVEALTDEAFSSLTFALVAM